MKKPSAFSYVLGIVILFLAGCSAGQYQPTDEDKDDYIVGYARALLASARADGATSDIEEGASPAVILERFSPSLQNDLIQGVLDLCDLLRSDDVDDLVQKGALADAIASDAGSLLPSFEDRAVLAVRHLCPDAEEELAEVRAAS